MQTKNLFALTALCAALAACGGGDGGSDPAPAPTDKFTQKNGTWTFQLPAAGVSVCYDFDTKKEVAGCTGTAWDLKVTSASRTATLWTNSGTSSSPSDTGKGGAFGGPFDHTWTELQTYKDATVDPASGSALPAAVYTADAASGAFSGTNDIQSAAFEYDLNGDHRLSPNFRVFLITSNSANAAATGAGVFALQVTGYYGGGGGTTSGYPSFRWIERTSGAVVKTAQVNASAGWVYYDLVNNKEVAETGAWQIAFNRYTVKLNGGGSGSGTVAGYVGKTPAGFYNTDGTPITSKFNVTTNVSDTLPDLTAGDIATPASASAWVKDKLASVLNPAYRGTYGVDPLDYGWFKYYSTAELAVKAGLPDVPHIIAANPANGSLIRGGEGNSYARVHLNSITYADPRDNSSAQTWTFGYDLQPASN
ncbi:hypothetical protein PIGHUM_00937 [Pigmentiphaga humi]|uniref:HmuY protein n=1 Tax=Pigmentiphaga humi TaxID=2478468 RepID=A0A3P4AZQ5_9BURK|nr:HmuY family protein [Pigmentiphaga humi]VCU68878.1 hypothetical protein PIGHUM_00937 [Pigmentiphaga humi]